MRTQFRRLRRTTAVVALAGFGVLALGIAPAMAEETAPETVAIDLGDLDNPGTGDFDQFDPALGDLTSVTITAEVSMAFDVCVTNLSTDEDAITVPAGSATGEAVLTFAGGVVATASDAMPVPELTLQPHDGVDDCELFASSGTAPSGSDSVLTSQSGIVDTFAVTITDPDQLAHYIGTGTVSFAWAPTSDSGISQPSEWTIVFLASGAGEATIVYDYVPISEPPRPPDPDPEEDPECIPVDEADGTESDEELCPTSAPTPPLPATGGPSPLLLALAGLLLILGAMLLSSRRFAIR